MANIKSISTPDLGGASDVTVIELLVKPGQTVTADTPVITLESDKATMEIPATEAGEVQELKVKVGDKVSTGSPLLTLKVSGGKTEKPAAATSERPTEAPAKKAPAPAPAQPKPAEAAPQPAPETGEIHAGPGVRRLAYELSIDLAHITGSGPRQRILKEDLLAHFESRIAQSGTGVSLPPAPQIDFAKFGPITAEPLSRIKKISGKNLLRNWQTIPHVTQFAEADISTLEEFRQSNKNALEKQNIRLTPLVFIMKAVVAALKAFPQFNASLDNTGEQLILKNYFHLGVAVDTPDGLVVPVIRDVDKKGLTDLAKELGEISEKARKKQLAPQDMQGGCFSISSLGGIGGTAFTPIINAPEVAILGVSKAAFKPVFLGGEFVPRLMLPLSLSYDHRVIDGADGARFIMHLTHLLSDIRNLLL